MLSKQNSFEQILLSPIYTLIYLGKIGCGIIIVGFFVVSYGFATIVPMMFILHIFGLDVTMAGSIATTISIIYLAILLIYYRNYIIGLFK